MMNYPIETSEAMTALGAWLASQVARPAIIYLKGELGMGKTTLTRGFMRGCGYQGFVKSPTFTVVESYSTTTGPVYHFDLYRIADPEELDYIGLRDYLSQSAICLFEWPEKADNGLPEADLTITITQHNQGRAVSLDWHKEAGE